MIYPTSFPLGLKYISELPNSLLPSNGVFLLTEGKGIRGRAMRSLSDQLECSVGLDEFDVAELITSPEQTPLAERKLLSLLESSPFKQVEVTTIGSTFSVMTEGDYLASHLVLSDDWKSFLIEHNWNEILYREWLASVQSLGREFLGVSYLYRKDVGFYLP